MSNKLFRFIDLFAGVGGFHIAASDLGGKCVFASEIHQGLQDLYEANFGIKPFGDIRDIEIEKIPKHDVLFAGFPCQPFSKAGAQRGRRDVHRGRLIDNVFEIISTHRPTLIVLENVPNILKQREGKYQNDIAGDFESLGYQVKSIELSPHQLGVPQIRKRIYFVASLRPFNLDSVHCGLGEIQTDVRDILEANPKDAKPLSATHTEAVYLWDQLLDVFRRAGNIPSHPLWAMESGATYPYRDGSVQNMRLKDLREFRGMFGKSIKCKRWEHAAEYLPPYALNDCFPEWKQRFIEHNRRSFKIFKGEDRKRLKLLMQYPRSLQKLEWNCKGDISSIWDHVFQLRPSGIRVRRTNAFSSLVAMTTSQVPIVGWQKRYLTPLEMARLQSIDSLKHLPSGSLAHSAFGNAVNATVVRHILNHVI